jgi:hypothetical protein
MAQSAAHAGGAASVDADQGRGDDPQRDEQPQAGGDGLRIEIVGEQQEIAQRDDDHGIASALQLHQLEGHQHDQQGNARVAAEQGAEFDPDRRTAAGDDQHQQPAAGQALVAPPQPGGPDENRAAEKTEPERLMLEMRCHGEQGGRQQPGHGVMVERQAGLRAHCG